MMRMKRFLAALLLCAGGAMAAPFAYVPNEKAGSVSVIDIATRQVVNVFLFFRRHGSGHERRGQTIEFGKSSHMARVTLI